MSKTTSKLTAKSKPVKNKKIIDVTSTASTVTKPTVQEIEKLKREVYAQNRKLIFICVTLIVCAVAFFFVASQISSWIAPEQWSYDAVTAKVLAGDENENQYVYNGLVFARRNNESLWTFQGNIKEKLYEITMYYGPNEVSDIRSPDLAFAQIYSKPAVILTLNTDLDNVPMGAAYGAIAAIELGKVLGTKNGILNKQTMSALTNMTSNLSSPFTVTCANASKTVGVIQIELSTKTEIAYKPNCVLIRGSEPIELVRAADRYVYSLLGVMPFEASMPNAQPISQNGSTATATAISSNESDSALNSTV